MSRPNAKQFQVIGKDRNGVGRVWAEHDDSKMAEAWALEEAKEYLKGRPDTGPLSQWTFVFNDYQKEKNDE